MTFKEQLNIRIQQLNSAEKLILINVVCFVLPMLIKTVLFLKFILLFFSCEKFSGVKNFKLDNKIGSLNKSFFDFIIP